MNVLVVAEAVLGAGDSGAERVLDGHVAGLVARGHRVTVVCAAVQGGRMFGADARPIGWSALTPWRAVGAARDLLRPGAAAAVIFHHPFPATFAAGAARRAGIRTVAVVHSPWHEEYEVRVARGGAARRALSAFRRRIERRVLTRVDRIATLSRFMARHVAQAHGFSADAIRIVPGGVDRARFAPAADRRATRRRLGFPEDAPLLFCLRNLEPRMGVDALLEAMPAVLARHPTLVLAVGGRGPLEAALRARTGALRLDAAVRFLGFVPEDDLAAHYAAADASVLPSQRLEGFGLVTLESLACGTPVLGTRVGATPELLEPLDPALLVDAPGPEGLARAITTFFERKDRDALGERCRAYTARFTWEHAAARLEETIGR
jgi:glycosyltransferase involved in cell wall biosynthesis